MALNNNFSFEIDFLPVGQESKSGDAIAMRWSDGEGFWVAVVDGGTQESGERLVEHVREVYGASFINLAINTHPDGDHSSGLAVVLDSMPVLRLWMHRPWLYPHAIKHLFRNGSFTTQGLSGSIRRALDCASVLERTAIKKRVEIVEPFQGLSYGPLMVLSPSKADYLKLIPHFNNTPAPRYTSPLEALAPSGAPALDRLGLLASGLRGLGDLEPRGGLGLLASSAKGLAALEPRGGLGLLASTSRGIGALEPRGLGLLASSAKGLAALEPRGGLGQLASAATGLWGLGLADAMRSGKKETWENETLSADGITTEQNESSVVLYGQFNGVGLLLTGDAGRMALLNAWKFACLSGIDLRTCRYYQVPHHGSRRNVSPEILDLLLGPKRVSPVAPARWAVASVAARADDHPRKAVVNAFLRRGVGMHATRGRTTRLSSGYRPRSGWNAAEVLPFAEAVEDD